MLCFGGRHNKGTRRATGKDGDGGSSGHGDHMRDGEVAARDIGTSGVGGGAAVGAAGVRARRCTTGHIRRFHSPAGKLKNHIDIFRIRGKL